MPAMSIGGLASGLDTNSIIAQLTALEQSKVTRELKKKENAQSTLDKFKELQTRLGNLTVKAAALESTDRFNIFRATSNYEDYAVVSGKEGGTAGKYEITVNKLATAQKVASNKISAVNTPLVNSDDWLKVFGQKASAPVGTSNDSIKIYISKSEAALKIGDPREKEVEVVINKTDTLKDIVNKINAAEGAGVTASMMTMADGDNRLVLTAVDTGTKSFTIREDTVNEKSFLEYIGILSSADNGQKAASANALLVLNDKNLDNPGAAATRDNLFTELNTVLNKNNITKDDVVGIYLPANNGSGAGGWVTFDLFDGTRCKSIGEVLDEINLALENAGADIKADINECGEIVLKGGLEADGNFNSEFLKDVKLQIGSLEETPDYSSENIFSNVKRDMGSFSSRSVFENVISEGQNAFYILDGMTVTSQSNSDDKTVNGTVFTLKKVCEPGKEPIKLSLELNMDAIASSIAEFIEEFNSLIKFIDENTKATVKEETDETTGQKKNTRITGAFTGDTNVSGLRETLRQMVTGVINELTPKYKKDASGNLIPDLDNEGKYLKEDGSYSTLYSSISRLGIITEKDGSLSVDKEKLSKALTADFEGVRRLFTTNWFSDDPSVSVGRSTKDATTGVYTINKTADGYSVTINGRTYTQDETHYDDRVSITGNIVSFKGLSFEISDSSKESMNVTFVRGIASQIANFVEKAKDTVNGYFKQSEKTYQARIDSIQKRVDELQVRVTNYNTRLTNQFNALERSMSNLQNQTSNMMAALSSLK
jgi:flagellar hook-associated protein 2